MDGLFLENGPFRVNKDLTLSFNHGSWHQFATMIYVDQPVGTGFSYVSIPDLLTNMTEVADYFTIFLDRFFETFPDLQEHDMYIAGESFAGTYIPYIARRMVKDPAVPPKYNLKGLAIGNGWMDPARQYDAYFDFAVDKGLLSGDYKDKARELLDVCHKLIKDNGERIYYKVCEEIFSTVVDQSITEVNGEKICINEYDIRLTGPYPVCGLEWPNELTEVTKYLRKDEVKAAIHVSSGMAWTECVGKVSRALNGDESVPSYKLLPELLETLPVLLFSGDQDFICNHLGTEMMIGNMTWKGKTGFDTSISQNWYINETIVGYTIWARNLQYVLILNGSHMVPYDKPLELLDMINRFMGVGGGIVDGMLSRVGEKNSISEPIVSESIASTTFIEELEETGSADKPKVEEKEAYSWGGIFLVMVVLSIGGFSFFWIRSRKVAREGATTKGLFSSLLGGGGRTSMRDYGDEESNELDDLVVEDPTIFNADEFESDEEVSSRQDERETNDGESQHFMLVEGTRYVDGEFDDFQEADQR